MNAKSIISTTDVHHDSEVQCWCCDLTDVSDRMVHLGNHPEVNICLGCAHFVHQQATEIEDNEKQGAAVFIRDRLRDLRAVVIRRGWHQTRLIGGTLRWLGKHLP